MLDFGQVSGQIGAFTGQNASLQPQREAARNEAALRLDQAGPVWERLRQRIALSHTSWLLAELTEALDSIVALPPCPSLHTVVAADGSQIAADRHDIALCYLLNVGSIVLRYGAGERATLRSHPILALPDDDMLDTGEGESALIQPKRLAIRRLLAEVACLADLIGAHDLSSPSVAVPSPPDTSLSASSPLALFDGSLILWPLETEQEEYRSRVLEEFLTHLEQARLRRAPIVGYISMPQSRDVINALRVHRCPHAEAKCDQYCPHRAKPHPYHVAPDCAGTERITDAQLFATRLKPGERTAVFGSKSKILQSYPPEQQIQFFYLNVGPEVARVELPAWVAGDTGLLALTHALCLDQARKGDGYPVALAEAHELAVIRAPERDAFFHLIERALVTSHQPLAGTRKALSKRARRV